MDALVKRNYPVIISALKEGAALGQIPSLIGIKAEVWDQIQADPEFQVLMAAEPKASAAMSTEEVIDRASSLTEEAFEALEDIINNPRATATARLQAANTAFGWREELQKKKNDADARVAYHLHIDRRSVVRMQAMIDMFMSDEGKAWLREMSDIMPNSTA